MKSVGTLLLMCIVAFACNTDSKADQKSAPSQSRLTEAESLLQQAVVAHGGKGYEDAHYQFTFRDKSYSFQNDKGGYTYISEGEKDGAIIKDRLVNGVITRSVDGVDIELSEKEKDQYWESLNSVIYFATLPHKLQDPAVNLEIGREAIVKEIPYDVLKVTFDKEGGGKDYDDQFHYWINKSDHTIDYLAYNYKTNKGGVRFRSAYNRRVVDGIIFQDYINYKAEIGTPLSDLPALYEANQLIELSKIETENVINLD